MLAFECILKQHIVSYCILSDHLCLVANIHGNSGIHSRCFLHTCELEQYVHCVLSVTA